MTDDDDLQGRIAVIGMAGRFPGARDLSTFWRNLRGGVESIRVLTEDELLAAGESIDNIRDPSYVRAAAPLADIDQFDAGLFAISPRDAAVFDPQHRIFLECAFEAFEHAGYGSGHIDGAVGVFASCGGSEYMYKNVLANEEVATTVGEWLIRHTGNDTNFLATRVSYELGLSGPSMNVQTACSSTLVAVHLACQSILSGECDMALAGGAVVAPEQIRGYFYKEGEILSPDGHCRAFDAKSAGTIISSAAGCVLLKPLAEALADGDNVLAVIRGSAINNDGRDKVGYLAPSVTGQARVVAEALAVSGVDARDVSYIETHGTGTLIGDPIEVAGLTEAYRQSTDDVQFCAIGSLKTNIGHTGEASGVAALIKTILSLQHAELPPSLHYESPNPQADFPSTPFFVNATLRPWVVDGGGPRIAGVTGLGAGGTNAHVLVEEAPTPAPAPSGTPSRPAQLITLSARSMAGVDRAAAELADYLDAHPDTDLADVAYTRLVGRKAFRARRAVVAASATEAATLLRSTDAKAAVSQLHKGAAPSVVFMMPGGGAQYAGMGRGLYDAEPVYRAAVDACCDFISPQLGLDLRSVLFSTDDTDKANAALERPSVALPALFATEFATAKLLASWGVEPAALIGHSAGEYVAACLSGVISMQDGLAMVALRGRLFETLPSGSMLSVSLGEAELRERLPVGLSIAAINSPTLCVASGPTELVNELEAKLNTDDIDCVRVHIDVAAHSSMLEPILAEFGAFCRTIPFAAPGIPYVSNLTGTWVTADDVTDPDYWVRHLRQAVRFSDGINTILQDPNRVLLEIGPGRTLVGFARNAEHQATAAGPTLRHPKEATADIAVALGAVARVWAAGADLDPDRLFAGQHRRRVPLPTYPFEHHRYWVDADVANNGKPSLRATLRKRHDVSTWFSTPSWQRSAAPSAPDAGAAGTTMIIGDGARLVDLLTARLAGQGEHVIDVRFGSHFQSAGAGRYVVNPGRADDWVELIAALTSNATLPDRIVHVTALGRRRGQRRVGRRDPIEALQETVATDHASVLFLAQALSGLSHPIRMTLITSGVHSVRGDAQLMPERALLHGAWRVIPRELGHVDGMAIDIDLPAPSSVGEVVLVDRLAREIRGQADDDVVAYRDGQRWVRRFEAVALAPAGVSPWRSDGVYLITGGLGGIGLSIAEHIATVAPGATLVLLGRTPMPPAHQWPALLATPTIDPALARRLAAVQRMQRSGCSVMLPAADVTDIAAITAVVADVQRSHGRITGVIHSAGILRDALIALRTPTIVSPVVDVKARGLLVVDQVLAKHPPELLVLCSSVSSIIGLPGQFDYTAANAFLDSFAAAKNEEGHTRAVVVNWNAWQEVGMAVDAIKVAVARTDTVEPTTESSVHLFDSVTDDGTTSVRTSRMSRRRNWLLAEHAVHGGDALMPGTGFVEILRSAATADDPGDGPVELRDLFFLSPFTVLPGEVRTLQVKHDRTTSSLVVFSETETMPHVTATALPAEGTAQPRVDLDAVRSRCHDRFEEFDGYSNQPFMDFGPRWGNLRRVDYGAGEALITTVMPVEFESELQALWLHPGLLDMAIGSAQAIVPGFSEAETFYVPFSYGRVLAHAPLPATAYSHVRLRDTSAADLAVFDITICDETGLGIVEIESFTMRRVPPGPSLTARRAEPHHSDPPAGESPIETALREGMLPHEGVDALDRLLAADIGPQVVATSVDLEQWIAKVDSEASGIDSGGDDASGTSAQYERPDIGSAYVPPATAVERELAVMWRELLGIERVGRDDDFFDLGGQSLIAVRLFTRMRKRYSVDLALSTLFEAPTIAQCAVVIAGKLGIDDPQLDDGDAGPSVTAHPDVHDAGQAAGRAVAEPAGFRSLVTIQKGGDRVPFFCVHGAGGNVLNFRDLSLAMGRSQPFYGLQARGIDGILRPHETIDEMAAAYLQEVRSLQPHGPYVFGGYSGGGLVAFEMAQQVRSQGEDVALVVLLDTFPPTIAHRKATLRSTFDRLREDTSGYIKHIFGRRLEVRRRARLRARLDEILAADGVVPGELRDIHLNDAFGDAAAKYTRQPWRGRVVLLRATDVAFAFEGIGDAYGWDEVVEDGFELVQVPGNHDTLVLEPNASRLVDLIRDTLEATRHLTSATQSSGSGAHTEAARPGAVPTS